MFRKLKQKFKNVKVGIVEGCALGWLISSIVLERPVWVIVFNVAFILVPFTIRNRKLLKRR